MTAPVPYTASQIEALEGKALLEYFNDVSEAMGGEPIRRFADRATGIKRTKALVAEFMKTTQAKRASTMPTLATLGHGPTAKAGEPAKAKAKEPGARSQRRGTNLKPDGSEPKPCREGSKQAILLDMLARKGGSTMAELIEALSGGNKPWTEVTVRSGFGWDMKLKGYGVRSEFDEQGVERFHIVVPEKFPKIPPHTSLKTTKPKNHGGQLRLVA